VHRITSRQNAIVARFREAARGTADGLMLLDGTHLVSEAVAAGVTLRHVVVGADSVEDPEVGRVLDRIRSSGVDVSVAASPVMDAISPVRSSSSIVALAERPDTSTAPPPSGLPLVAIVCDIQDPGNVGAIVRVAEGAGATGVVLAGRCADPFGWKALRGSMGSALRMPLTIRRSIEEAVAEARRAGLEVVAAVPRGGVHLYDAELAGPLALLIGGEGPGLSPELVATVERRLTIPMAGPVESLNAAVAAAVLLYECARQRAVVRSVGRTPVRSLQSHG
jgi:TrmH family RNA methyltransferase